MRRAKGKKVELSDLPLPPASDSMATCRPSVNSSGTPLSRAACGEVATMLYAGLAAPLAGSHSKSRATRFLPHEVRLCHLHDINARRHDDGHQVPLLQRIHDMCSVLTRCTEVEESREFDWLDPSWTRQEVPCLCPQAALKGLKD